MFIVKIPFTVLGTQEHAMVEPLESAITFQVAANSYAEADAYVQSLFADLIGEVVKLYPAEAAKQEQTS